MRKTLLSLPALVLCLLTSCGSTPQNDIQKDEAKYVNPFIGTGEHGHTFPGATRPFAMVQLSPDTHIMGWDASSGYHYDDTQIYGFSHTHLSGTGIGDLGDVALLPFSGADSLKPVATFNKNSEKAVPGYYAVRLENFGIDVELTSTDRVGFHKYTYDNPKERYVMLDLGHVLQPNWGHSIVSNQYTFVNDSTLEGTIKTRGWAEFHSVSYRIVFSEPIIETEQFFEGNKLEGKMPRTLSTSGEDLKFHYKFAESKEPLYVKVGISMVDPMGATNNLMTELPGWDFDATKQTSYEIWNRALNVIQIETEDHRTLVNFYTALYHSMIAPYVYQDLDGRYLGMDKQIHKAEEGYVNYSVFSLWDTFRALHPLMSIIDSDRAAMWGEVLVQGYKEGGVLPKWPLASSYTGCMVAYPAVSVLADLATKDLAKGDMKEWAEAAQQSSIYRPDMAEKFKGTRELDLITMHPYYKEKYGFVPADSVPESVSWGVEMAYDDWCVSQLAAKAGNDSLAREYAKRGEYYKHYLDPETKMMRGVMGDGSFRTPFNPRYSSHMKSDYTEGNAFQWSFFVPHDMDNYIAAIGGKKELETRLDTLFTTSSAIEGENASADISGLIGQYAHGNEPSHHMAYLYNWTDSPWKGQERLDYIMQEFYTNNPDGIIGNEDCGQMSAWYVMSALGLYQVAPGIPQYTLGRPMVDSAKIKVQKGIFEVIAHNNSTKNKYVKEVKLNGQTLTTPFISHKQIANGGKLEFFMSDTK